MMRAVVAQQAWGYAAMQLCNDGISCPLIKTKPQTPKPDILLADVV